MKKSILVFVAILLVTSSFAQNVGIGTASPVTKLDVVGDIALREGTAIASAVTLVVTLSATAPENSFYRVTGTTNSTLNNIANAVDGQIITLVNATTAQTITISNNNTNATGDIITGTGASIVIPTGASFTLQYSATSNRWYVTSQNRTLDKDFWKMTGNGSTTPSIAAIGSAVTAGSNFLGTTDAKDLVIATNNGANTLERMRVTSGGNVGFNTITPTSTSLLTINPTTSGVPSGVDMTMSGATSTAYGINIASANVKANGILTTNSSNATTDNLFGVGGVLSSTKIVSGYLGYRTIGANQSSYGLYGVNGTTSSYSPNTNTWALFAQGRAVISSENAPTSPIGTDLEVRNTSTGASAPATVSLRQTTSLPTTNNVLSNLNFGDDYTTQAQARIQASRDAAAGSATDCPTAISFSTTPDGTSTLTEGMRLNNVGQLYIGSGSTSSYASSYPRIHITSNTNQSDGIYHVSSASSSYGFYTNQTGTGPYGFYANQSSAATSAYGAYISQAGSGSTGTYVTQPSTATNSYGVYTSLAGNGSIGLYSVASGNKGTGYVNGAYISATGTSDPSLGIYGISAGPGATGVASVGILGSETNTSVGTTTGQYCAVAGIAGGSIITSGRVGVFGGVAAINSSSVNQVGVVGVASQGSSIQNGVGGGYFSLLNSSLVLQTDVWLAARSGSTNYGILSGATKSTTINDPYDDTKRRIMYCTEAPEVLFEDHGFGQLINGKIHIDLDPIYISSVTINSQHPLRVFVQLEDDCKGVFITNKTPTGFDVVELQSGDSNAKFSYRVVANRSDEILNGEVISEYANNRYPSILKTIGVKQGANQPALGTKNPIKEKITDKISKL